MRPSAGRPRTRVLGQSDCPQDNKSVIFGRTLVAMVFPTVPQSTCDVMRTEPRQPLAPAFRGSRFLFFCLTQFFSKVVLGGLVAAGAVGVSGLPQTGTPSLGSTAPEEELTSGVLPLPESHGARSLLRAGRPSGPWSAGLRHPLTSECRHLGSRALARHATWRSGPRADRNGPVAPLRC
jgi:hypothetical protein